MSANNWAMCPKCKKNNDENNAIRIKNAEAQYGKISSDEYRATIKEAEKPMKIEETLREDFEIWINDKGLFTVSYSGRCQICGFAKKFEHREKLL